MTAPRRMTETWRGIIAVLIACAFVMAPLAAQAKMAHHAASHALTVEHTSRTHDGHDKAVAAHHHADHDHAVAHDRVPTKSSQTHEHDHRSHHDGSCCGTYCHSACTADTVETMPLIALAAAYATFTPVNLTAVAPDQPQRPPSIVLSI